MSTEKTTNAAPVDGIVIRPFAVPTGDIIRGLIKQIDSGVVVVNFGGMDSGWPDTLNKIAEYLDRVESDLDG